MTPGAVALLAFVAGIVITGLWSMFRGCSGGHVWDDGTDRYHAIPYDNSDNLALQRETTYRCKCENCHAQKSEKSLVRKVHRDDLEAALDDVQQYVDHDPRIDP